MGSTRYPGKMSKKLGEYPLIDWVIQRSKESKLLDEIILATSSSRENNFLINRAKLNSIKSFKGSENNVLSRFLEIGIIEKANICVRICGDNPLICGSEIDRIINFYLRQRPDYAFNHVPLCNNNYVDGVGAEVFSFDILKTIASEDLNKDHLEHVTKYFWDNNSIFEILTFEAPKMLAFPNVSLDINTKNDFLFINNILSKINGWKKPTDICIQDVLKLIV